MLPPKNNFNLAWFPTYPKPFSLTSPTLREPPTRWKRSSLSKYWRRSRPNEPIKRHPNHQRLLKTKNIHGPTLKTTITTKTYGSLKKKHIFQQFHSEMFPPRFLHKASAFQHLVVTLNPSNRVLGVGVLEPICVAMLPAKDVPRHHRDLAAEEVRCSAVGEVGEKCDPAEVEVIWGTEKIWKKI